MVAVTHLIMAPAEVETNSKRSHLTLTRPLQIHFGVLIQWVVVAATALPCCQWVYINTQCVSFDTVYHVRLVYALSYEKQNADILCH